MKESNMTSDAPTCNQGQDLVALASASAIALAKGKTTDELDVMGSFLTMVGDALALMSARQSALENNAQ